MASNSPCHHHSTIPQLLFQNFQPFHQYRTIPPFHHFCIPLVVLCEVSLENAENISKVDALWTDLTELQAGTAADAAAAAGAATEQAAAEQPAAVVAAPAEAEAAAEGAAVAAQSPLSASTAKSAVRVPPTPPPPVRVGPAAAPAALGGVRTVTWTTDSRWSEEQVRALISPHAAQGAFEAFKVSDRRCWIRFSERADAVDFVEHFRGRPGMNCQLAHHDLQTSGSTVSANLPAAPPERKTLFLRSLGPGVDHRAIRYVFPGALG